MVVYRRARLVGKGRRKVEVGREVEVAVSPGGAGRSGTGVAVAGGGEQLSSFRHHLKEHAAGSLAGCLSKQHTCGRVWLRRLGGVCLWFVCGPLTFTKLQDRSTSSWLRTSRRMRGTIAMRRCPSCLPYYLTLLAHHVLISDFVIFDCELIRFQPAVPVVRSCPQLCRASFRFSTCMICKSS